jgi:type II secretory pathway pseudopilin PulG
MAIVVLIMGSMAAMIAPGLSQWMADARASAAAEDLLRIGRVVRARVNDTGLAHLLVFRGSDDAMGSKGLGRVQVWEGMNNHCNQTPWMQTINGLPANGHQQIDGMDLGSSEYNLPVGGVAPSAADSGRQVIVLSQDLDLDPKATAIALCFEPGGMTFTGVSATSDIGFTFTPQTAPVTFTVTRSVGGVKRGVDRQIVFPASGNGRLRL